MMNQAPINVGKQWSKGSATRIEPTSANTFLPERTGFPEKRVRNLNPAVRLSKIFSVMANGPVVFIDSGVGGLPYLEWVRREQPEGDYLYVADPRNFPYGVRPPSELISIVGGNIEKIRQRFDPVLVVIACNTATVHTLAAMRERFSFPLVGVVPAVKPAAIVSPGRRIGILATERTVRAPYLDNLVKEFASDCAVYRAAAGNIIDYVEKRYFTRSPKDLFSLLEEALSELKGYGVDTVVLGCTHFIFLSEEIGGYMGPSVRIIDSREGVGRQVLRVMERERVAPGDAGTASFMTTGGLSGEDETRYREFAGLFHLKWGGDL